MCLDDCACKVSSPYKVFNLVAVANMSEKNTSRFIGGVHPPLGCHGNHLSLISKILTVDARDNFDNTCKQFFSYLKEQVRNKKIVKGGGAVHPHPHKSFSY